jgi:hypothetical protein
MRNAATAIISLAFVSFLAASAQAEDGSSLPATQPLLVSIAGDISSDELQRTITRLVGFGTRHTLSDTTSTTRGIGAARRWIQDRFVETSRACGGCLQIKTLKQAVTGPGIPTPTEVVDVLAIQRGTSDPDRMIVISAHLDSRVTDVMNATSDAPGADDNGSGLAAVLEAARVLSKHTFAATLVYAVTSGEEQGLYGGKELARYALQQRWQIEAVLNNDIIGSSTGTSGVIDNAHIRVFSEGTRATETPEQAALRRYNGGEVDSPSRNLARFISGLADRYLTNFGVRMVYRTDRFRRGGDQMPMLAAGYPAVRFTEAIENYTREHQDVRTADGIHYGDVAEAIDFTYLRQAVRLNAITLAALASAPRPPATVQIDGAVSPDTTVHWTPVPGAAGYRVWWRDTTAPFWTNHRDAGDATSLTLKDITIDDWFFGVSSVSKDGFESPVEFPGRLGAFDASDVVP